MALSLDPGKAAEIDAVIRGIYGTRFWGNELPQLARLFKSRSLISGLDGILSGALARPSRGYSEQLEIKLAWIDKRPMAELSSLASRVELGDAALFFFDRIQTKQILRINQARALILQAKAAKEKGQLAHPAVPINPTRPRPNSSTAKELALLSQWNKFDLYAASGSDTPIVRNIAVASSGTPPPYGWYMATPKVRPTVQQAPAWTSPWMCAPAQVGLPCDITLGQLLAAFFASQKISATLPDIGANFQFDEARMRQPQGQDWSRMCVELLRLCRESNLPQWLFGRRAPAIDEYIIRARILRSLPYLGSGESHRGNWLTRLRDAIFPRRMPVLLILLTRIEGEG